VSDIDNELRELFLRRAEDVPPHREVPSSLASRARHRIALNAVGAAVVVAVLAAGAFTGVRALTGPPAPRLPGGNSSPSPSQPGPSASTISACTSAQLRAVGSMQGAAGSREGGVAVTNLSSDTCTLQGTPTVTLLTQTLAPITSGITVSSGQAGWVVDGSPKPAGWPVVTLLPGDSASVRIRWSNWCPGGRPAPVWRIGIPGGGTVDVNGFDSVSPPPCNGPGQPSTIEVGPFEPRAGQ
jgi:uncharacterized protein DUF4232